MIGVKQFTRMLEQNLNEKFPEFKASLYVSRKKENIHMGLDIPLFSLVRHNQLIKEIKTLKMLLYSIEKHFKMVFPQQIGCTRWKFDYIIMKKKTS